MEVCLTETFIQGIWTVLQSLHCASSRVSTECPSMQDLERRDGDQELVIKSEREAAEAEK